MAEQLSLWKQKLTGGIALKLILVTLSFVQAHWIPIACAAGTVAAATMFGDKAYWTNIDEEARKIIAEKNPQEAVKFIEAEIAKYSKWREQEKSQPYISHLDEKINDLYYHLAKAKEAAGLNKNEVLDAYMRTVASPSYSGEAFVWLYKNIPGMEHQDVFKQIFRDATEGKPGLRKIVQQIEESHDWSAFESFFGIVFGQASKPVSKARLIESSLKKGSEWNDKFIEYCRNKPKLIKYAYEVDCKKAKELVKRKQSQKAVTAYRNIIGRYKIFAEQNVDIELEIYKSLFNIGDYNTTLSELNGFLERNKAKNRKLASKALLLKAQCYIQQSEVDKATNEFLTLLTEYPETKESQEATFFLGYCYMLQSKFDQAKEAFNLVIKDYPQSSFTSKAKLYLTRIESMTEK